MTLDWSLVLGNPFWLGSIPFAILGWLIAFIGQCVADRTSQSWFFIIFQIFLIVSVFMIVAMDAIRQYRIVIVAFSVLSISYSTTEINGALALARLVPAFAAIASGYIFITIVVVLWVVAFGSSEDSFVFIQLNSYSVAAKSNQPTLPVVNNIHAGSQFNSQQGGIPMGAVGSGYVGNPQPTATGHMDQHATAPTAVNPEYAFKAKALYTYEANNEDPNELSFAKGDLLDIVDNKGKWWQARREDGTVGIAPSNYLQII